MLLLLAVVFVSLMVAILAVGLALDRRGDRIDERLNRARRMTGPRAALLHGTLRACLGSIA